MVLLERNLQGRPLAGVPWERRLEEVFMPEGWETARSWESLYVHRQADLFLSVFADDKNMAGRRTSLAPIWLKLKKSIDLEEPAPLIDQVCSGYTQRESVTEESNVKTKGNLFAQITTTETDVKSKMKDVDKIRVASWSCDMKGHAEKCVERHCDLARKSVDQLSKVSTP